MKLSGDDAISTVFMGDGAWGEGVVYETMNMASLWALPLLVVVENNGYSQSTPIRLNMAGDIASRFAAFGIETAHIDSTDVLEIDAAAAQQVAAVRTERRPRGLIIDTYRLCHHSKSDDNRPEEEIAERWTVEPLVVHGRRLPDDVRGRVDDEVEAAISEIVARERAA
jgi:TPP-dependent pyruvate/acetoin dehydrogenase alpha subunit